MKKILFLCLSFTMIWIMPRTFAKADTVIPTNGSIYESDTELNKVDDEAEPEVWKIWEEFGFDTLEEYAADLASKGIDLDEVYDGTEPVLYEDDFKTLEGYKEYLASKGISYEETIQQEEEYQTKAASSELTAKALYKAALGETNHAIQSYYISGSQIYICQHYEKYTFNKIRYTGNLILLSRCKLSNKTFTIQDSMLLTNVGHGQTLDMYTYGGKPYFLISCGGQPATRATDVWSTQIGRITYSAGTVLDNSNIKRLTYLDYSHNGDKSFGVIKRVDAALSTDKKRLLIWKQNLNGDNQFSVYNFVAINQQLSSNSSNTVSFQNNGVLKYACKYVFNDPVDMPGSIQGLELSNVANNMHSVYISSGNESKEKNKELIITRFNTNGDFKKKVKISDKGVWGLYDGSTETDVEAEIEGLKIAGSNLQFVLRDPRNPDQQVIAYVSKSKLE